MQIDIKKLFKPRKKFRKGGFHTNPNISWEMIIALVFVVAVGFFAIGIRLFTESNKEFSASFTQEQSDKIQSEQAKIEKTLNYFNERREKSNTILSTPARVVDPSR